MSNTENISGTGSETEQTGNIPENAPLQTTNVDVQDQSVEEPVTTELTEEDILNMSDDEINSVKFTEINAPHQQQQQDLQEQVQEPAQTDTEQQVQDTQVSTEPTEEVSTELAFYQQVTAPFKANGTQVQIKDPKDAIRLMQMGLNYNEKMANLKPHMRILRSLDKAGLLDESKLNYLIDLSNHKPEAIAQLLKESETDTYNLPDVEEQPYQATDHMLSEQQVSFEETVKNISSNPAGNQVLQAVNGWDEESMSTIYKEPYYLEQLTEQKESGLFDDVMAIIKRDSALGKIDPSKSMVELYNDVATYLLVHEDKYGIPSWWTQEQVNARNKYRQDNGLSTNVTQAPVNQQPVQQVQQRQYLGSNVQHQSQQPRQNTAPSSASIPSGQTNNPVQTRVSAQDILDMSDEEFEQFQTTVKFTKN